MKLTEKDVGKKFITRDGSIATIIGYKGNHYNFPFKVVTSMLPTDENVENRDIPPSSEYHYSVTPYGRQWGGETSRYDIIAPKKKVLKEDLL